MEGLKGNTRKTVNVSGENLMLVKSSTEELSVCDKDTDFEINKFSVQLHYSNSNSDASKKKSETIMAEKSLITQEIFKKPSIIDGLQKGHPTKIKTLSQDCIPTVLEDCKENPNKDSKNSPIKQEFGSLKLSVKTMEDHKIGYVEPLWGGNPEGIYNIEVLKSGVILEVIDLSEKSYHIIGRLPSCDIPMAHPTISRFHAILQYRATSDEKNKKGMYIFDLNSTHGTFWNGNRIKPKVYVHLLSGHMIRFGCSQRKFILQAPLCDQEPESEFSVTELKEIRKAKLEEYKTLEKQNAIEEQEAEKLQIKESDGIDWGMKEDADEESDMTENPYAQTNNEELFLDDPKKTLRGWFEREGYDLQYQIEDKGIGRFLCWVDLPLDNASGTRVRAEALVTGKKKEAVVQCALEACRILDRYDVLRQANHEAKKKKNRNWEEKDYYASDEDDFLDRTGIIEKKRQQRMRMAGKLGTKVETYKSLFDNHLKVVEKIQSIESLIASQKSRQEKMNDPNEDALDAFMSTLDSSIHDKTQMRKMKMDLLNLRKEESQLVKLMNIAKPINLPSLKPFSIATENAKNCHAAVTFPVDIDLNKSSDSQELKSVSKLEENAGENQNLIKENEKLKNLRDTKNKKYIRKMHEDAQSVMVCNTKTDTEFKKSGVRKKDDIRSQQRLKNITKNLETKCIEDEFREDYSMWVPPVNQNGDGKTRLNEKFGY